MPFPRSDREIYSQNPLEQVICQLRFPTILNISAQPPAKFQQEIRGSYPLYHENRRPNIPDLPAEIRDAVPPEIRNAWPGFGSPEVPVTYTFQTADETRAVQLTQDSVAVSESRYDQWDGFRTEIEHVENILREIYSPAFYTRIGLRYRDVLDRRRYGFDGIPWAALLNPSFLGVLGAGEIAQDVQHSQTQVLLSIPDVDGGYVLLQHGLTVGEDESSIYLIDADFYTQDRCDHDAAITTANKFNRWAGHLFRWIIRNPLRAAMVPRAAE